ncbi:hypothetical protein ACJMK2_013328 [Sinanodonta woodiana]|uniref:Outer dynein arm-docking complex subunit 4 n=1 Tax=Sinanodonta woodiana TaxID=1069815 RepID=A0ABD3UX85_SINWO
MVQTVEAYPCATLEDKRKLLVYVYCCMGETSMEMGHLNDATEYHEKAKKMAEESGFKDAKSRVYFNLGEVFHKKGEYQRAIDVWTEELPNVSSPVGSSLFNYAISICFLKLDNYMEGLEHGDMSLSASDRSGDKDIKLYATTLFAISEGTFIIYDIIPWSIIRPQYN